MEPKCDCDLCQPALVYKPKKKEIKVPTAQPDYDRKFKHMSANSQNYIGKIAKITQGHYGGYSYGFLLNLNIWWGTEDNSQWDTVLSVGDEFQIVRFDSTFVYVKDITVEKLNKRNFSVPKDKILAAAKKSIAMAKLLKELVPDAFDSDDVPPDWAKTGKDTDLVLDSNGETILERRGGGKYKDHIWLSSKRAWRIETEGAITVLVSKPKK
jgi:hypothetical protein